jgi:hypothetical protein
MSMVFNFQRYNKLWNPQTIREIILNNGRGLEKKI